MISIPSDIAEKARKVAEQLEDCIVQDDLYIHADGIELIAEAINAERSKWQTIDTAPRDGSDFLAFGSSGTISIASLLYEDDGQPVYWDGNHILPTPTHWMPLPEKPTT